MLILVMDVERNTTKTEKMKKQEFSLYRPGRTGLLGSFFCVPSHLFTVSKQFILLTSLKRSLIVVF